jgi:hypothetical protein
MKYNNNKCIYNGFGVKNRFEQIIWNFTKKRHFYFKEKDLNKISLNSFDRLEQSSK